MLLNKCEHILNKSDEIFLIYLYLNDFLCLQHHRSASCSFNPEYPSHTYSPYSNEESVFDFHRKLRTPFDFNSTTTKDTLSADWITYPGHRTSLQSNIHPKLPDPARLEELSKVNIYSGCQT